MLSGEKGSGQIFQYLMKAVIIECFKVEMLNQVLCLVKNIDS